MARIQKIYKLDRTELERDVALLEVIGEQETAKMILAFCKRYSIPLDAPNMKTQRDEFETVAEALKKAKK